MVSLNEANKYLSIHSESNAWISLEDGKKADLLEQAESYIKNTYNLRTNTEDSLNYLHAVCEQAIHLLTFDKERSKLQREGVTSYKFEDINFQMLPSFISPIAYSFLKKHIYKKVGEITL